MRFAIRNFRDFEEWVEFDGGRINLICGPNGSGKSSLVSALLLVREQRDPFRLSFSGAGHGLPGFLDALPDRDPHKTMDLVMRSSVDAASILFPSGESRPEAVNYDFDLCLSYAVDEFNGGASGILVMLSLVLLQDGERTELFAIHPCDGGYEFFFDMEEVLCLPFVHARAVASDAAKNDAMTMADRAIEYVSGLERHSRGHAKEKAGRLLESLGAAKHEAAMNRELERIVLPAETQDRFGPLKPKEKARTRRIASGERKYLRSLADIFIAESLAESGLRSMVSRESGREIRLSFYSVFYDILEAAGFLPSSSPPFLARFPAERPAGPILPPGTEVSTATGAGRQARAAEERYAALLRDAVNISMCRRGDGSLKLEGPRLGASYGAAIIAFRDTHQEEARRGEGLRTVLVSEGMEDDPDIIDLEKRRAVLRSFLSGCRIAEDVEFFPTASEEKTVCVDCFGQRVPLGDLSRGPRRLVLVALSLLYLPWGSELVIEDPEAGLDREHGEAMARLLRLIAETTGATILAETRSSAFAEALGPYLEAGPGGDDPGRRAEAGPEPAPAAEAESQAGRRGRRGAKGGEAPRREGTARIRARTSEDGLVRLIELAPAKRREEE